MNLEKIAKRVAIPMAIISVVSYLNYMTYKTYKSRKERRYIEKIITNSDVNQANIRFYSTRNQGKGIRLCY